MGVKPLKRVQINVSGEIFETYNNTLKRFPETLLGNERRRERYYCSEADEYFLTRNRQCFVAILFYYQSRGILCCPPDMEVDTFADECSFFDIPAHVINAMKAKDGVLPEIKNTMYLDIDASDTWRAYLWNTVDNPETSFVAKVITAISLLAVVTSVVLINLETLESMRSDHMHEFFHKADLLLNAFFFVELVTRFILSPSKVKFARDFMNVIDCFAIIPNFVMLLVTPAGDAGSFAFLRILRLIRVLRLFKLSKQSKRLQIVSRIIYSSLDDLRALFMCLYIGVVFMGSVMYQIELSRDSHFVSIPDSLWWGVVTITTVGYGDIYPLTAVGRLVASGFMVIGALTTTLPVLAIVTKFEINYQRNVEKIRELEEVVS